MKQMGLSVVINTKNAAETLEKALRSVRTLADEVVVVDMRSTDQTVKVARRHGARVYTYHKELGYADPARNFALGKAQHDWILVLDADEEIPPTLAKEIKKILALAAEAAAAADAADAIKTSPVCYFFARQNEIMGGILEHTGWWPDYQPRLFRKGTVSWQVGVHRLPDVEGEVVYLPAKPELAILHHNYPTVSSFIQRLDRYTSIAAKEAGSAAPRKSEILEAAPDEFLSRFFGHQGLADGVRGFALAWLQASYELVTQLKRWENAKYPHLPHSEASTIAQLTQFQQNMAYWVADWQVQHTQGLVQLWWLRCGGR